MSQYSCPNCGDDITPTIARARLMACPSCGSSVLIENEAVRLAGSAGVMAEVPLLFDIGDTVICGKTKVELHGHARFSYGRGWWDEYWGTDTRGEGV